MKVIKKGQPPAPWGKEYTCTGKGNDDGPGCDAVLLVEEDDLFQTSSSGRGEATYYTTFRCPECRVRTDIPTSDVPYRIVRNLTSRPRSELR